MNDRISRRNALALLGTVSLGGALAACGSDDEGPSETRGDTTGTQTAPAERASRAAVELLDDAPACSLSPEQTEGPFYLDVDSIRRDIRQDRPGRPLRLALRVRDSDCRPVSDAAVEIWHCDALGNYSGFESASQGAPGGGAGAQDETYLRGAQITDADGIVEFLTIYPGWYAGRTVHIHAKAHVDKRTVLTSQLYFDDAVSTAVFRRAPYSRRGERDTLNSSDGIYDDRMQLAIARTPATHLGAINLDIRGQNAT